MSKADSLWSYRLGSPAGGSSAGSSTSESKMAAGAAAAQMQRLPAEMPHEDLLLLT